MNTWSVLYDLCMGFGVTLKLFALTLVISIPLGLLFAVLSMTKFKPVSYLMKLVIWGAYLETSARGAGIALRMTSSMM